jgi:DNA-binding transcriptional LysR family regulator
MDFVPARLRSLQAVVRHGSFSRAAEAMHLSQPAVSTHVRRLEADVGVALIERAGKRAFPTPAGELVLRSAQDAVARFEEGLEAVRRLRGSVTGRLRLGASATVSIHLLPQLLRTLRVRYPDVEVSVATGNAPEIGAAVVNHDLDAALLTLPVHGRELVVSPFFRDELVAIAAPSRGRTDAVRGRDRPRPRRPVSPRQLAANPLILYERGGRIREVMERWFEDAGCRPRVALELGNAEAIKELVAAGLGMSLMSAVAVRREVQAGRLIAFRVAPPLHRDIGLIRRRTQGPPSAALTAFLEVLAAHRKTIRALERASLPPSSGA